MLSVYFFFSAYEFYFSGFDGGSQANFTKFLLNINQFCKLYLVINNSHCAHYIKFILNFVYGANEKISSVINGLTINATSVKLCLQICASKLCTV